MKTRIGVAALCAMTLGGALGAQDRQTFRTATRLVEVSVVVTDGAGNPIRGLTRKDFTVTEAGAPQEITFFEVLDESRAMPPTIEAHGRPDRPSDFSNAVPRNVRTMTVILLDRTNAAFASQWYAHKHAERYLRQKDARDRVALYVWDGAVRVLHDFTDDAASLLEALETYRSRVSGEYEASEEPPSDTGDIAAWIVDPGLSMSEFFQERRAFSTLEAFEMLAAHLKRIAGRKQIVWLSEAFAIPARFGRQEFLLRLRRATNALSDAQASLYPVDARGLVGAIRYTRGVPSFTSMATIKPNNDTMEIIAEETGARAFANTNDLAASIRRAVDDSRVTYVLGYYAPNAADGKFRRIDVDVKGRKVIVRHRSGYFAEPPPSRAEFARESAVRQALEAPLQATAITLTADAVRT